MLSDDAIIAILQTSATLIGVLFAWIMFYRMKKQILKELDEKFSKIDERFDAIDKWFDGIDKRFDGIDKRFDELPNELSKYFIRK